MSPFLKMTVPMVEWVSMDFSFMALKVLPSAICFT